jgi:GAF domain-containing protein
LYKKRKYDISGITPKVTAITLNNSLSRDEKLYRFANFKRQYRLLQLGWVYFANQELHLGPYVGAETDHTVILSGKGFADR